MDFRNFTTAANANISASAGYDQGLRSYMLQIYNYMAVALIVTALAAIGVASSNQAIYYVFNTPLKWVVMFAPLGVVMYLSSRVHQMTKEKAQLWFFVFSALMGISLSYIFLVYTGASVVRVFFITSASYAGLSLYGYTTKKDLSGMASFLIMGLIGIMIASIVNLFLASSSLQFAISAIGVLVFAGLTAYDTQNAKNNYYRFGANSQTAIMSALSLYMNFINLFIMLLNLFGNRR